MSRSSCDESPAQDLYQLLRELDVQVADVEAARAPWLIVAAHPDDETVGATWLLRRAPRLTVLHVTDGAPRDSRLRNAAPREPREAYAARRAAELRSALRLARGEGEHSMTMGVTDQEAANDLHGLVLRLVNVLEAMRPAFVVVHAYEGGHPDHDATAFAAHAAVERLARAGRAVPVLLEMTSYHRRDAVFRSGCFLQSTEPQVSRPLNVRERRLKARMVACFSSQLEVLRAIAGPVERYRRAPAYDFGAPPHAGSLNYDRLGWSVTGARFCALARAARASLDGGGTAPGW